MHGRYRRCEIIAKCFEHLPVPWVICYILWGTPPVLFHLRPLHHHPRPHQSSPLNLAPGTTWLYWCLKVDADLWRGEQITENLQNVAKNFQYARGKNVKILQKKVQIKRAHQKSLSSHMFNNKLCIFDVNFWYTVAVLYYNALLLCITHANNWLWLVCSKIFILPTNED